MKVSYPRIVDFLNLADTPETNPLNKIIQSYLNHRGRTLTKSSDNTDFWTPEFFGLNNCNLFLSASPTEQRLIVNACERHILSEIYFLEKISIAFSAKMMLHAKTIETSKIFSLIASDEATHLHWISPYVAEVDRKNPSPFICFTTKLIEDAKPELLYYLVQTLLEGWGLHYYQDLAKHCLNSNLKEILERIIQDEHIHHHTGTILFDAKTLTPWDSFYISQALGLYANTISVGPQAVVSNLEKILGKQSLTEKEIIFKELKSEDFSKRHLDALNQLMYQPGLEPIVEALTKENVFKAFTPKQCAEFHANHCVVPLETT